MKIKVSVDSKLCIGAGICYAELSEVYESLGDGTAQIKAEIGGENAIIEGELAKKVLDGLDDCPTAALIATVIEE